MECKIEELEIKEELMIHIANHLPFIVKGSFLTKQYHKDPQARLKSGGDIDLIYHGSNGTIPKLCAFDYESRTQFLQEAGKMLKHELLDIFYKLEEIMTRRLELTERPGFILELEYIGFDDIFERSYSIYPFLVNYAADGDFATIGLEISDPYFFTEIDIAIDMPVHFQPETILYRTLTGKEVMLKNTTPLIYQTAWKIHQIIVRPRLKDLDDVIRFLPHIDFKDRHNFEIFFDEIISECKLTDEKTGKTSIDTLKRPFTKEDAMRFMETGTLCKRKVKKTCKTAMDTLKKLFTKEDAMKIFKTETILCDYDKMIYYSDLYGIPWQIEKTEHSTKYDTEELEQEVCSCFLKALHSEINCNAAVEYIEKRCH